MPPTRRPRSQSSRPRVPRSASAATAAPGKPTTESTKVIKGAVSVTEDTPVYYANYIEIGHSFHEFAVSIARAPVKLSQAQTAELKANDTLRLDALVQVVLPVTVIPGLIRALTIQRENYESRFGKINEKE